MIALLCILALFCIIFATLFVVFVVLWSRNAEVVNGRFTAIVSFGNSRIDDGADPIIDEYGLKKFSSGPVVTDYLAEKLHLKSTDVREL